MKTIVSMLVFLALASVVSAQVVYESKEECLARPDGPTTFRRLQRRSRLRLAKS